MNKFRFTIKILAIAIFMLAFASMAQAQATRTWVSGVGDDVNPCSRTAPCKTFAGAISKTASPGEIDALDPGGFGAVTITKSITIDGGGGQVASVLSSGVNGIVVAAQPGDVVTLENLRIQGAGTTLGLNGIRFLSGKALNVLNCYIYTYSGNGIDVALNQAGNATVFVSNTTVKNCAGDGMAVTNASTGQVKATIEHSSFVENGNGLHVRNGPLTVVSAANSVFSLNSGVGVFVDSVTGGGVAVASIQRSQISGNNGIGARAGNGGNAGTSAKRLEIIRS